MKEISFQVHLKTTLNLETDLATKSENALDYHAILKLYRIVSVAQDHMQHSPSTLACPHALSPPQNTHVKALTECRMVAVALAGYKMVAIVHCSSSSS